MADINSAAPPAADRGGSAIADARSDAADGPHLIRLVELFFFAYRDFTAEADAMLAQFGFGRAHHRVLHFVNRNPGLRVADLLDILRITKQSLARVLKQLVDEGYVAQTAGTSDRRERLLQVTAKGAALADRLAHLQRERVGTALRDAEGAGAGQGGGGGDAHDVVERFLCGMVADSERDQVARLMGSSARK